MKKLAEVKPRVEFVTVGTYFKVEDSGTTCLIYVSDGQDTSMQLNSMSKVKMVRGISLHVFSGHLDVLCQ